MDLTMDNTNVNVQAQDLPILRITHKVSGELNFLNNTRKKNNKLILIFNEKLSQFIN